MIPSPDNITELAEDEIFVFGSNLDGRHGAGAALFAKKRFGAVQGIGEGMMGRCYALPTVGHLLERMSVIEIATHVGRFLECASKMRALTFLVTPVGCGLAGHSAEDIAPMFASATNNVRQPQSFLTIINTLT